MSRAIILCTCLSIFGWIDAYTVKFKNKTDKTWTMEIDYKTAGVICDEKPKVTIGPGETTEKDTGACGITAISNITAQEQATAGIQDEDRKETIKDMYKSGMPGGLEDYQDIEVVIIGPDGSFVLKDVQTPLSKIGKAIEQGIQFVGATREQRKKHVDADKVPRAFVEPSGKKRLNDIMLLGSHNAYAHPPLFSRYYQHEENLATQFKFGIRAFELDTYDHDGKVHVCHGACGGAKAFAVTGKTDPNFRTLTDILNEINGFLDDNKKSVVIVYLENSADPNNVRKAIDDSSIRKRILTPNDWNLSDKGGLWPKLSWMRNKDKRVVLFSNNAEGNTYAWKLWRDARENFCCTTETPKICGEREESLKHSDKKRTFYFFKYFDTMTASFEKSFDLYKRDRLQSILDKCKNIGINDMPNVILIDRSEAVMSHYITTQATDTIRKTFKDIVGKLSGQDSSQHKNKHDGPTAMDYINWYNHVRGIIDEDDLYGIPRTPDIS